MVPIVLAVGWPPDLSEPAIGLGFLAIFLFALHRRVQRNRTRFVFYRHGVETDDPSAPGRGRRAYVPYRDVRQIRLDHSSLLTLVFGLPSGIHANRIALPIETRMTEDVFDRIVEHIEEALPDHLLSISDRGAVRYTWNCPWRSMLPEQPEVTEAKLFLRMDEAIPAPRRAQAVSLYRVSGTRDLLVRSTGRPQRTLLQVCDDRIHAPDGMILGNVTMRGEEVLQIDLGDDAVVRITGRKRIIAIDGAPVGRIYQVGTKLTLRLDQPQPELFAIGILLSYWKNSTAYHPPPIGSRVPAPSS